MGHDQYMNRGIVGCEEAGMVVVVSRGLLTDLQGELALQLWAHQKHELALRTHVPASWHEPNCTLRLNLHRRMRLWDQPKYHLGITLLPHDNFSIV